MALMAVAIAGCTPGTGGAERPRGTRPEEGVPQTWPTATPTAGWTPLPTLVPVGDRTTVVLPRPTRPLPTLVPLPTGPFPAALAVEDLARRLRVSPDAIVVVSVAKAEMPIQDLGCYPDGKVPDITLPGIVIGEEIVLQAQGGTYVYHARGLQVVYCGQR